MKYLRSSVLEKKLCLYSQHVFLQTLEVLPGAEILLVKQNGLLIGLQSLRVPLPSVKKQGLDLRYLRQGYLEDYYIMDLGRVETTLLDLNYWMLFCKSKLVGRR